MVRYSISSVSLSPPHFKYATTLMRLRASLHWVFRALMCSLKEQCESHHSPRNFADSSTGRSVSRILIVGGLWALCRGAVKCTTLHLWAATLNPFLVAIPVWHLLPAVDVFLWCQGSTHENRSPDLECSEDVHGNKRWQLVNLQSKAQECTGVLMPRWVRGLQATSQHWVWVSWLDWVCLTTTHVLQDILAVLHRLMCLKSCFHSLKSCPIQVNVSQSCFHSLNNHSSLIILSMSGD